jgi:LacI family transcriptional regulator
MHGRAVPTIRDVAARAGVATATVSNVLTGRRPVADGLRRVVLAAVQELGYERNHLAASLRLQRTRSVGIVVPDLTNPFFAELVRQIEEAAARSGFQILLVDSNEEPSREAARIRALLARRIDGLVMAPTTDSVTCLGADRRHPPTILIDRGLDLAGFDSVGADNVEACYRGCRHLLELGHKEIALLVTVRDLANIRDRIAGYRRALAEYACADRDRVIIGGAAIEGCRAAIEPHLRGSGRPTAVFAAAYVATLGAIQAIRAVDLAFPEDVSLLGFDDFDWMTVLRPYVSTMRQPVAEMASHAWTLLMSRCEQDGAEEHARLRLPCTLEVRESTRPPSSVAARRRIGRKQREERQ